MSVFYEVGVSMRVPALILFITVCKFCCTFEYKCALVLSATLEKKVCYYCFFVVVMEGVVLELFPVHRNAK